MNFEELLNDKKALARIITEIENDNNELASEALRKIKGARIIGITGVFGCGKSTLISKIAQKFASNGEYVGILGIDPSSPLTGGAVLGDRIRMRELNRYDNVFIRSISSGRKLGGISYHTPDIVNVLDAAGFNTILIETVGSGQDEVDIMHIADTVIVVIVPLLGDEVQVIKAGQFEIGDIFIVNKADQGPADEKIKEMTLVLKERKDGWTPKIIKSVAIKNQGIDEILKAIMEHWQFLNKIGKKKIKERILYTIKQHAIKRMESIIENESVEKYVESIMNGNDLNNVIDRLMVEMGMDYGKGRNI